MAGSLCWGWLRIHFIFCAYDLRSVLTDFAQSATEATLVPTGVWS
jgi:hypothetical protein